MVAILGCSRAPAIRFAVDQTRPTSLERLAWCLHEGKVERMIREVKESFLAWLSGQAVPLHPTLADYDALGRRWIEQIVLGRRHRTTNRIVGEAWADERGLLRPIPERVLASLGSSVIVPMSVSEDDLQLRRLGERVEVRDLAEYEKVAQARSWRRSRSAWPAC